MSEGRPATPPTNPETLSPVQNTHTDKQIVSEGRPATAYQPGDSEPCPKHTDKQTVSEARPATPPTNPETLSPVQNTQTNRPCQRGGQRHRLPIRRLGDLSKTHTHRQTGRVRGEASDTTYQPGDSETCPKHTHRQTGRVRGEASDTAYQPGDSETCPKHTHRQTGRVRGEASDTAYQPGDSEPCPKHTDKQTVSEGRPATPPTNPETLSPVQNTQTNRPCQRGGQRHRLPTRRL